ncbi:Transcription initiation factor TFIID subunit 13 [Penicillium paradoxum]|uniref:Transcription initiation factor TFIID subunit 13 n=1 Tax=Penicillium paradoxum TaxID=176176 RepID=UPI002547A496|nr:Transcription initiation factor TFIID subunit 13 [Penicillium paradoxum]KAJ5794376.1 Transcription initiation factor TFIID subunit 13 [Penicillium paradoxum]
MSAKRTVQTPRRISFQPEVAAAPPTPSPTPTRYLPTPISGPRIPIRSSLFLNSRSQPSNNCSSTSNARFQAPPHSSPSPNTGLPTATRTPTRQPSTRNLSSALSPNWYFNEQDTALIRAGYEPQWTPKPPDPTSIATEKSKKNPATQSTMAEPRARMARHKGQMNFQNERKFRQPMRIYSLTGATKASARLTTISYIVRLLLLAYGDPSPHPSFPNEPLPETIRVLDEIVTDFVLEVSHGAAQVAHHARRQKIKVEDFRFALRRDPNKLGRVQELLRMERELKEARKAFDQNDDQVAKEAGKKGAAAAAAAAAAGEDPEAAEAAATANVTKKSKGKGKRGAATRRGSDATEESVPKKRKTIG